MLQDYFAGRPSVSAGRTAPAPPATDEGAFRPLFATRSAELEASGGARRIEAQPEPELLDEPQVELVQENGKVQRIVVTCTCCKRIEIECEY